MSRAAPPAARVSTWRYLGMLLVPGIGTFALNAVTAVLPEVGTRFGADSTALEVVVAGYGVPFAVVLILGGRLGDRYGRHRLFLSGMGVFLVAAVVCALAPSMAVLIAARVAQGLGAALCTPQVLGTIQATATGPSRLRAIAAVGASGGIGAAVGQIVGGSLAEVAFGVVDGWRMVFVILAGLAALSLVLTPRVPHADEHHAVSIDAVGTVTLGVGILSLSVALTLGPVWASPWPTLAALTVAAGAFVVLWRHQDAVERGGRVPLLPPSVLRLRPLQVGLVASGLFFAGYSALLFVFPRALAAAGSTSFEAALTLLPFAVVFAAVSLSVARIQARVGESLLCGALTLHLLAVVGMAMTLVFAWGPGVGLWMQPSLIALAVSRALIYAPLTQLVVREVPVAAAGLSGGMFSTVQQLSLAFGVLLVGGLVNLVDAVGRDELVAGLWLQIALAVGMLLAGLALPVRSRGGGAPDADSPRITRRR